MAGDLLDLHAVIDLLAMERHHVAGWYSLHYSESELRGRSRLSSMYYLLAGNEPLPLHRLDGVQIWHHCRGAPAEIVVGSGGRLWDASRLGGDLRAGERPQLAVPAHFWQSCRSLGDWTLFGCVLSPGYSPRASFVFADNESQGRVTAD